MERKESGVNPRRGNWRLYNAVIRYVHAKRSPQGSPSSTTPSTHRPGKRIREFPVPHILDIVHQHQNDR
jgi:hypothetical protein